MVTALPQPIVRPERQLAGAWIGQKVDSRNAIALCSLCRPKFDFKRNNYVPATRWGRCIGTCDGCREHTNDQLLFIHESTVSNTGGRVVSGTVYVPL